MQVDYSKETRRISLQRGEAMFKVMKDQSRPFIVNAGSAVARAVGTRFGVERREDRVRVTVAEGKVAVVRGGQAAALEHTVDLSVATALVADEGVDIPVNAPTVPLHVEKVNSAHALAWANGQLILQTRNGRRGGARSSIVATACRFAVDDPEIADWHVCCVFDAARSGSVSPSSSRGHELTDIVLVREGPNTLRIVQQHRPGRTADSDGGSDAHA